MNKTRNLIPPFSLSLVAECSFRVGTVGLGARVTVSALSTSSPSAYPTSSTAEMFRPRTSLNR